MPAKIMQSYSGLFMLYNVPDGMWDIRGVRCLGIEVFFAWDVRCSECGMFGIWDLQGVNV